MLSASLLFLGLLQLAVSKPLLSKRWNEFDVKHSWAEVPRGWELHGPAPEDYKFNMRIALKQDRFEDLVTSLYEVSDPYHSRYVPSAPTLSWWPLTKLHIQVWSTSFKGRG